MLFRDRVDAGRRLAGHLEHLRTERPVVVGLPRGGVPVAAQVADALAAPLDVIVVRKLGVPGREEFAMGAIGEGVRVLDDETVTRLGIGPRQIEEVERRERSELERRLRRYRGEGGPLELEGRTVILVDDGVATGATATAACRIARAEGAARVVLAVPVAPRGWSPPPEARVDEFVCPEQPAGFMAIGQWYDDFSQTSDEEVASALSAHRPDTPRDQGPHGD